MAFLSDLYQKYGAPIINGGLSNATNNLVNQGKSYIDNQIGGIAHGVSDVIASKLYQPQIDAQNQRAAQSSLAGIRAAQVAHKPIAPVYNAPQQTFEQNVLGRPITTKADVLRSAGNLAGLAAGGLSMPIPALEAARPLVKLAGYGAEKGVINALPNAVSNVFQGTPLNQTLKQVGTDFAVGAVANTVLSPRLTGAAIKDVGTLTKETGAANNAIRTFKAPLPTETLPIQAGPEYAPGTATSQKNLPTIDVPAEQAAAMIGSPRDLSVNARQGTVKVTVDPSTKSVVSWDSQNPFFIKDMTSGASLMPGRVGNPTERQAAISAAKTDVQNYFNKAAQDAKAPKSTDSLKSKVVEATVDPYAGIKYKPGTKEYTDSYIQLNTNPNVARNELEHTLQSHNDILSSLQGTKEKQAYEQLRQLQTLQDNIKNGLQSPLTNDQINAHIAQLKNDLGARFNVVQEAANKSTTLFNNLLNSLPGVTKETKAAMLEANPHYSPLKAISQDVQSNYVPGAKPINQVNKSNLKGRVGFTGSYDPNTIVNERTAMANLINAKNKQSVVDTLAKEYGTPVGVRDTANPFLPGQNAQKGYSTVQGIPPGLQEMTAKTSDGKIYAVPPKINDYLTNLDQKNNQVLSQVFGKTNKLFRAGATTGRIPFIITNPMGDIGNYIQNRTRLPLAAENGAGKVTLGTELAAIPKAIASSFKETFGVLDSLATAQKNAGGEFGGAFSSLPKEIKVPWSIQSPGEKVMHSVASAVSLPYNLISALGQFTERIPRRAEFYRNLQAGKSAGEAALNGLDVTANFGRFGTSMRSVNEIIPFLNAQVQGGYSTYQAALNSPLNFLAKAGAYVVAPTVGLTLYNKATGRDSLVDENTKQNYLYFILPTNTKNSNGETVPVILKFRKKEFPGMVSEFVRNITNGDSPVDVKNLPQNTLNNVVSTLTPPIIKAPVEAAANYNFFTGSPIVPQSNQGLTPPLQVSNYTSDTFRKIGETLNVSPAKLQQAVTDLFPSITQITDITDKFANPQLSTQKDKRTALEQISAYLPVIGVPRGDTKTANAIYDAINQLQQQSNTQNYLFKQAIQNNDQAGIQKYSQGLTQTQIDTLTKNAFEAQNKQNMTPTDKALQSATAAQKAQIYQQGLVPGLTAPQGVQQPQGINQPQLQTSIKPDAVQLAMAKNNITSGQSRREQVGNTVLVADPTSASGYKTYDLAKVQSDAQAVALTNQSNAAKAAGDLKGYVDAQTKILQNLQAATQKLDPQLDQAQILTNQAKMQTIQDTISKYQSQGGFTKPKAAKKSSVKVPTIKSAKVSTASYKAPSLKIKAPKKLSSKIKLAKISIKQPKKA